VADAFREALVSSRVCRRSTSSGAWHAGLMRRFLFDSEGNLRLVVLIGLLVLVPVVVLALATWGGWAAMALIAVIVVAGVGAAIRYG
jgi:hypothetical protein